jgi:hypothetical protein
MNDKIIRMTNYVRITEQHLLGVVSRLPYQLALRDTDRTYWVAISVIKYFFGNDWLDEHLDPDGRDGFLRQMPGDQEAQNKQAYRILDLAELLFNLQDQEGFADCIERMKNGDVEGTYAELDFGRMLHMHRVKFRFVVPTGKKGGDYDIEIESNHDLKICADAKCKIHSTEFSVKTIWNTLHDARTQFPPDRPSALFVKMPPHWMKDEDRSLEMFDVANKFLRQTKRVVSVKFYVDHLIYDSGVITHIQAFKEISNPNNRFDPTRNWDLFNSSPKGGPVPASWQRLINFPKDPKELQPCREPREPLAQ